MGYETTSARGDLSGSVNPTRSKVKKGGFGLLRECLRAARPMLAGRSHEAAVTAVPDGWPPARASGCTEPGLQASSLAA